jgi:hypothetical protein
VVNNQEELFYAMSIYIPRRFARLNIVDWDDRYVTAERPALFTAVVDNYVKIMKGDLLQQWQPIFRQDTNSSVVLYLIVIDDAVASGWEIQNRSIAYAPLSAAFTALFSFSYFKFLFDPTYDGAPVNLPAALGIAARMRIILTNNTPQGTFAKQTVQFRNTSDQMLTLVGGTFYSFNDGSRAWNFTIAQDVQLAPAGNLALTINAGNVGPDPNMVVGADLSGLFSPALPANVRALVQGVTQGVANTTGFRMIGVTNNDVNSVDLLAGTYTITDTNLTYTFTIASDNTILAGQTVNFVATATVSGADSGWTTGNLSIPGAAISGPALDPNLVFAQVDSTSEEGVNGASTSALVALANTGNTTVNIPAVTYSIFSGTVGDPTYSVTTTATALTAGGVYALPVQAATIGSNPMMSEGADITGLFVPALPSGLTATSTGVVQGLDPGAGSAVPIPAGNYFVSTGAGGKMYPINLTTTAILQPGAVSSEVEIVATTDGEDPNLTTGFIDGSTTNPVLPIGININVLSVSQGQDAIPAPIDVPSMYWDLSLALAFLCKNNIQLSWFWSLVKISYVNQQPNSQDPCWIRFASRADQLAAMTSLLDADRGKYYWAALYLLECQNTCVIVHSEFQFIIADILAAWFARKNDSRTFIGNKLSLLRLSGTRIKPLGWPSWLDSSINENDHAMIRTPQGPRLGVQELDDMNVGYLTTIADNTPQESALSMARGVGDPNKGIPVTMQMIAKYVDYICSQEAAKWITDTGTLTAPVLTDEVAYAEIQSMVMRNLSRFSGTNGRIYGITMEFPSFEEARVSRTKLSAASAWRAWYKDDLDTIEVSGGIIAQ